MKKLFIYLRYNLASTKFLIKEYDRVLFDNDSDFIDHYHYREDIINEILDRRITKEQYAELFTKYIN
jgi:hypothetical protein